jgi:hypothetical protein
MPREEKDTAKTNTKGKPRKQQVPNQLNSRAKRKKKPGRATPKQQTKNTAAGQNN